LVFNRERSRVNKTDDRVKVSSPSNSCGRHAFRSRKKVEIRFDTDFAYLNRNVSINTTDLSRVCPVPPVVSNIEFRYDVPTLDIARELIKIPATFRRRRRFHIV